MLKTFRVVDGFHYGETDLSVKDTHAPRHAKGQLIQSWHDLDVTFPQKFERYVPIQEVLPQSPDPSAVSAPPPLQEKRQSRVASSPAQSVPDSASAGPDDDAGPVGKDVTTSYPAAMEQDFKVFLHRGQCTLYDGDDLAKGITRPLNANPIPTDKVDTAVAKLLRAQPV